MPPVLAPSLAAERPDAVLLRAARSGSKEAFEQIVARYQRPLRSYCGRLLDPGAAEDAVQQAFLQAYTALRADRHRDLILRPWLYRIAHNCAIDILRRGDGDEQELDAAMTSGAHPAQQFEGAERLRDVMRGLRALPDDQRRALVARELEGRSYQEISDELGASHGGVRQLIFRARTTLRSTAAALLPLREWCWWLGAPRPGVGREAVVALAGAAAMGGVVVPDALRPPGAPPAVRREARTPSSSPSADPSGRERSSAPRAGARRPGPAVRLMAAPQGATPPRVRVAPGPVASVPRSPRRAIVGRVAAPAPTGSSVAEAAPPAQSAPVAGAPAAERAAEPAAVAVAAVAPPVPAPSPSPGTGTPVPPGSGSGTPGSGSGTSGSGSGSGTSGSGKNRDRDDDDDDEERDDRDDRDERDERDERDQRDD